MSKSTAVVSYIVILAMAFFSHPIATAVADPLPAEQGSEFSLVILPSSVSRDDATKMLVIGRGVDASTVARLRITQGLSGDSAPKPSPALTQAVPDDTSAHVTDKAKASGKLGFDDCIGSGTAYTSQGLYKGRWSWCQTHTIALYVRNNGVVVGTGFFDVTLVGEGLKGSRTAKLWQYITNVKLSGTWPPGQPVVRFTMPCGGWPTAKNCKGEGGQTLQLSNGSERLISYKYTSSTSGTEEPEKVGIGVFKPQYVLVASGETRYGYEQGFRCDSATYLGKNGACVFDRLRGTFKLSRSDAAVDKSAKHIYDALRGAPNIYPGKGKTIPSLLSRMTNKASIDANRNTARAACKKKWPKKPAGKDCDEYPFAATNQGAAKAKGKFSVRYVTSGDNRTAGRRLAAWYKNDRILNGEKFEVKITS